MRNIFPLQLAISLAVSCELICYALVNIFNFSYLYSHFPQLYAFLEVNYYINNYNSVKIFMCIFPLFLGLVIYLFILLKNKRIKISLFILLILPLSYAVWAIQSYTYKDIYAGYDDPTTFFDNYKIILASFILIWLILTIFQELLRKYSIKERLHHN